MVVPDPPLSRKSKDKDAVLHIASPQIASPTTSQEFSQFNGYSSSVTSYSSPGEEFNHIVTNPEPSHLSNLALFAKNKTPSGSGYSKIRTGSQSSSNSWPRKYVKNKNLKFHVKYGIACAIPELYAENTYSGQNSCNSDYSYSASCYDTPAAYSYHNISTDVNGCLSSSRYITSNFPLSSNEKGLHHQIGEGPRAQFSQSVYNTQSLQESSSVTSGSSKKRWKNKNSKLRKEAYSTSKTDSVKPFFCLYGKIVHTDDCKCRKVNLWNISLLSAWHPDKVNNSDTTSFSNIFQNNFDEDIHDLDEQVSSISEEITTDGDVSLPVSVTKRIHSGQTKVESICESAQETNNQLTEYDLESKLRVFSPETADCYLPLKGQLEKIHGTSNFSSREKSESESLKIEDFRQTYDSVKNLPFESLSTRAANLSTELKEKVQVNEPDQHNALTAAAEDLAQSLYTVTDSVIYSQTKNNNKASDRPATKNDLSSCLALFDNLIFDIEDQLEGQVPYRGESFLDEQFGLDPLAVPCSQSTTTMASQVKKNKNQFLRKAAPASPVNKSSEEGSRLSCPDVISIQSGIAEVRIDSVSVSTGLKDMNVTSKNESAQVFPPEFGSEQHGIPSDAGAGDGPCIPRQKYDPGGIDTPSSINIRYSDHSSSVPTIQSHPYSSPTTGSSSQSAYQTSTGNNGTPPVSKAWPPVPPAKPPRTSKSETLGQYSVSSMHKKADLGSAQVLSGIFSNTQQQQASRLQRQDSQQFANNFDDDDQEQRGYPGQRQASHHPWIASEEDIQFQYLEEQARMQYEGSEILYNNRQQGNSNKSTLLQTQFEQNPPFYMKGQRQGQFPSSHMPDRTHYSTMEPHPGGQHEGMMGQIPRVLHAGKMRQISSGHQDYWMDQMQSGQNSGQMDQQKGWQHGGFHGGIMGQVQSHRGLDEQMPDRQHEGRKQMPGMEHGGSMQSVQGGLDGGIVGQMHPHAQLDAMQPSEQGYIRNFQDVHNQHGSMAQGWDTPTDRRHGDGRSSATYSPGVGVPDYTGMPSYMTDRELAQEQLDQKMNNPWFQQMVQNMKELVERESLVVKDVFPDGNCLFTAVVDQLRVHGNFKYTPSTLRTAAVDYLIKNPEQRDGTHLEQFLMNETWNHYLGRMSRDGEWGEHIILGAISEVLRCRINVLGGISGKTHTIVQPQHMSDKEEEEREKKREEPKGGRTSSDSQSAETAKSDTPPSQEETSSEISQSKTGSQSPSPQTGAQSKLLQTDAKAKSTDTSQRKDKTASRSKQNWAKENEELTIGEELFIGLLGEMHYVSLRRKDWEERLHEKLWSRIKRRETRRKGGSDGEGDSSTDDDMCLPEDLIRRALKSNGRQGQHEDKPAVDGIIGYGIERFETRNLEPIIPYLNLLLKCTDLSSIVIFRGELVTPSLITGDIGSSLKYDIVGGIAECIEPQIYPSEEKHLKLKGIFPTPCRAYNGHSSTSELASVKGGWFGTPKDTFVCDVGESEEDIDLMMIPSGSGVGYICLIPVNPSLWRGKTSQRGKTLVLEHILITNMQDIHLAFQCVWPKEADEWLSRSRKSCWLKDIQIDKIRSRGCRVIPVSNESTKEADSATEWKLSFAVAQRIILRNCTTVSQKNCYRITKMLLDYVLVGKVSVHGDLLKNVFMFACDEVPLNCWASIPAKCILFIINKLLHGLRINRVPNYFLLSMNMLEKVSRKDVELLLRSVSVLSENSLFVVYFLIDYFGYMNKTVGKTFDRFLCEIGRMPLYTNIQQSYSKFILPEMIRAIDDLVHNNDFKQAGTIYLITADQIKKDIPSFPTTEIQDKLKTLSLESRWCLAFFIDQTQNDHLLEAIFHDVSSVSIAEVIGPECCKDLGYLRIPTILSWRENMLSFVWKLIKLLDELKYYDIKGKALMYFLDMVYDPFQSRFVVDDIEATTCPSMYGPLIEISKRYVYLQLANMYLELQIYLTPAREDQFIRYLDGYEHVSVKMEDTAALLSIAKIWINHGNPMKARRPLDIADAVLKRRSTFDH